MRRACIDAVSPFFSMNSALIVLRARLLHLGWVADGDDVQWDDGGFDAEDLSAKLV
jgi:hypothetical protein